MDRAGRLAVVTGGAKEIGRGLCARLQAEGWQAVAPDIDGTALGALPPGVRGPVCDVADEASVAAAFDRLGAGRIDLPVNTAGIAAAEVGPVEHLALADWRRILDSHLTGAFLVTRAAVPALRAAGGSIVNIASTRAFRSEPDCEACAAAKGGIVALTHALAVSLGPEVRVDAIAPGRIVTDPAAALSADDHAQHPAGRAGRVGDVAGAVLWLAGAGFVTGQTVVVDGGMTRRMIHV